MKYVKNILFILVVLFFVFYLVTRPVAAAEAVRTVFVAVSGAFSSIVTFFTALAG